MVRTYSFTAPLLTDIGHCLNETERYSEDLHYGLDLSHLRLGLRKILYSFLFGTWEKVHRVYMATTKNGYLDNGPSHDIGVGVFSASMSRA